MNKSRTGQKPLLRNLKKNRRKKPKQVRKIRKETEIHYYLKGPPGCALEANSYCEREKLPARPQGFSTKQGGNKEVSLQGIILIK